MEKLLFILIVVFNINVLTILGEEEIPYEPRFEYQYKVLDSILKLERKDTETYEAITSLFTKLEDAFHTIEELNSTVQVLKKQGYSTGSTYVRWGRTTCPEGDSVKVYDGWAGGSYRTHTGSGSNLLCMPYDPIYGVSNDAPESKSFIYGTKYAVGGQFQNHEVPCAVCWIPRSSNLMLPARNECYPGWKLEYHGYLAGPHYTHHRSDYVCLDENKEITENSLAHNSDGALLYYVETRGGPFPRETYSSGWDLTCAVCSYSPQTSQTTVQPYA